MAHGLGGLIAVFVLVASAYANDDGPMRVPPVRPQPAVSAEARYNQGLAFAKKNEWVRAEEAYRDALRIRSAFPEAWNGLGHALRKQERFDDSVRAYQQALRLRPDYPQALEYLGEAYVRMGKIDDAKSVLARLRSLDPGEAAELAAVIDRSAKR